MTGAIGDQPCNERVTNRASFLFAACEAIQERDIICAGSASRCAIRQYFD
jgi:hypothetical protein